MVENFESVRLPINVKWSLLSTTCSQNCRSTENNVSKHEAVISTALDTASIPTNYPLYALHTTNHYGVHSFGLSLIHIQQYFSTGATQYFLVSPSFFCDDNLFIISLGRCPITPDHGRFNPLASSRCRVPLSFPVAFHKSRWTELVNSPGITNDARQGSHPTESTCMIRVHIFFRSHIHGGI